jgi:hypothetical protein
MPGGVAPEFPLHSDSIRAEWLHARLRQEACRFDRAHDSKLARELRQLHTRDILTRREVHVIATNVLQLADC